MAAYLEVFGGGVDMRPLDPPGICTICEATPDQSVTRIINTNRFFRPQQFSALVGRKYICSDCASDLGKAIGQVDGADHAKLQEDAEDTASELAAAKETISSYAALDAAIRKIAPKLDEVTDEKPKKAPAKSSK